MADKEEILTQLAQLTELLRNHLPWDRLPEPTILAGMAAVVGVILAFWGARLIKPAFVLLCMTVGVMVGVGVARSYQVDTIFGLVIGGGLAGVVGYLFFRWWVGLMTGLAALVLVSAVAGPRIIPQEIQGFSDHMRGVGTGNYEAVLQNGDDPEWQWNAVKDYFWNERRDFVTRTGLALALSFGLGLVVGLVMPRLAAILGTSVFGVLLLAIGAGGFLSIHFPKVWGWMLAEVGWFLALLAFMLIMSLSIQANAKRRRPAAQPEAQPEAA